MRTVQFLPDENPTRENFNAKFSQLENLISIGGIHIWTESIEHPGCFYRMVNGVQEWLNPPMVAATEYRTTKRYLGKPVYAKLIPVDWPNATISEVSLGVPDIEYVVDLKAAGRSSAGLSLYAPSTAGNGTTLTSAVGVYDDGTNRGTAWIVTSTDRSGISGHISIEYTKTTD